MAASLAVGLRTAFLVLGCVLTATIIYTLATDGSPFRKELLTPWMVSTLIDFYFNILPVGAWIVYKESNFISAIIWVVLVICLGSITTCAYIVIQFLKLSPEESLQDPIYFVLLNDRKKDGTQSKCILSVLSARILFSILGCIFLVILIYTIATDGSPFRRDVYTPWMIATLLDFSINLFVLSVWVAYKESNWKTTAFWIILLICFGSTGTCSYIVLNLFRLLPQDPAFLVLFSSKRAANGYEGIL
ncbi:hypothetical protein CDL12_22448 [Handroanthus impetiginosus]|uniref:Uncharacterized protein n=1 Tax=Handroanthus impetiginosus TaxID=429701 RepID=A0A2G9GIA3_9LAMI|nr:hypothetical protein CDL12_22448 [Handroanthus impetiginosus]